MLLGETTKNEFAAASGSPIDGIGLQTIYNLEKWPKTETVIVGGGAIINNKNISKLRERINEERSRFSIIGIDVLTMDLDDENIEFLRSLPYLSARSIEQAERLRAAGATNCRVMPDIVLAYKMGSSTQRAQNTSRVGVNVVPALRGGCTARSTTRECASYRNFLRELAQKYINKGQEVVHIPFTPYDDQAAKEIFRGIKVRRLRYSSNSTKVVREVAACTTLIPSRFHALIISILTDVPFVPLLYAGKSERLLKNYLPSIRGITIDELASCSGRIYNMGDVADPILPDRAELKAASDKVRNEFSHLSSALDQHG